MFNAKHSCIALTVSAVILAIACLAMALPQLETPAQASDESAAGRSGFMVQNQSMAILTAPVLTDLDAVWMLDKTSGKVLVYIPNTARGNLQRMEPVAAVDLAKEFQRLERAAGGARRRTTR